MKTQGVLTVVTEIHADRVEALGKLLAELSLALSGPRDPSAPPLVDFRALGTVHFARFVILPADSEGKRLLAFSTAYDGPRTVHLSELCKAARAGLCSLYEHCVGFPEGARAAPATFAAYLDAHSIRHGALHVGYVGRSVQDIQDEERLRRFLEERLDALPRFGLSAKRIRDLARAWVQDSELRWALGPREAPISPLGVDGFWSILGWLSVVVGVVVGAGAVAFSLGPVSFLAYVGGLAAAAIALVLVLRHHELTEPAKSDTNVASGLEHAEVEDVGIRNQLTHLVEVKPGLFRRLLLHAVLHAIEVRARFEFYEGDLGGIETIHCAHWVVLPGPKPRLLFFSNYDGSWERYLGDFIEEAGGGMTSVWSNTVDFPRARLLLLDGARNERVFKAWTREHQVKTDVWYRATPDVSVRNVNDNSRIRDGLTAPMSEDEAKRWLSLF